MKSRMHLTFALALGASLTLAHEHEAESVSVADFKNGFIASGLVPEVLAAFNPSVSFYVAHPTDDGDAGMITPGAELTIADAAQPLEFSVENILNGTNVTDSSTFLIYMIGPDVPSRQTPTSRNVRHFLAGNFTVSSNSSVLATALTLTNSSAATNEYMAPAPKASTGSHRYAYLLYLQPSAFDSAGFESVGLNVSNRMNFNLSSFRSQAGLGPAIGGTYFTINTDNTTSNGTAAGNAAVSLQAPSLWSLTQLTVVLVTAVHALF